MAALVWSRLGNPDNYIEPFYGSGAVLLGRPQPFGGLETVNDLDCYVVNFWRATQRDPEAVAAYADGPVIEVDLHARHKWLVLSDDAKAFRQRMRTEPEYYDAKVAGWWCWGLCCWIGGGWCSDPESPGKAFSRGENQATANPGSLRGVHSKGENSAEWQQVPQLADAYDVGRGVNSNGPLGTCDARRAWLIGWFGRLRDRLRLVRSCCGDWRRVCDSESVTTRLGLTGIFFDPPYGSAAGRNMALYACDSGTVAGDVLAYCRERGGDSRYRICLCGYEGEGHCGLESEGWKVVSWKAQGGYGNRSKKGKDNALRERVWFSPHCLKLGKPADLFAAHCDP